MAATPLGPDLDGRPPEAPADELVPLTPPGPDGYELPPAVAAPDPCNNTAHQFAGWTAVYRPLCPALGAFGQFVTARFPPDRSDLDALEAAWRRRLEDLRAAGAGPLASQWSYARARDCRPHAFAYAGKGRPCRFWFCPYCAAAEAGEAYYRIRRAREKAGPGAGLYLSPARFKVPEDRCREAVAALLSRDPGAVGRVPGVRAFGGSWAPWPTAHNLVRVSVHPLNRFHSDAGHVTVSVRAVRTLTAKEDRRARAGARKEAGYYRAAEERGRERVAALREGRPVPDYLCDPTVAHPQGKSGYRVHPTPKAEAKAAAHLVGYPAEVLTAPVGRAADVLNLAAGTRQSVIRGAFRSAAAIRAGADRRYVRTSAGIGLTGPLLPLVRDPGEALAARGFAGDLGLEPADSFAAVGAQLGWPCYWVGCYEFNIAEQFGVKENSPFGRMVRAARPKRPGAHHLLVSSSSIGYLVFWTPSPADDHTGPGSGWDRRRLAESVTVVTNYKLRRIYYYWAPVAVFRRLALDLRITGPRALPPAPTAVGDAPGVGTSVASTAPVESPPVPDSEAASAHTPPDVRSMGGELPS